MKSQLLIAGVAVVATACSTMEPAEQYGAAATQPASGLMGPRGADGPAGPTGERGDTTAGAAGVAGSSGAAGVRGAVGESGAAGPVGIVGNWTAYRQVMFMYDRSDIHASERDTISEVAEYLTANPSLQVGIDSSIDPSGTDARDQGLSDRRTDAVRTALIEAGVPAARIRTGVRGDVSLVRDRRVGLLVSTLN